MVDKKNKIFLENVLRKYENDEGLVVTTVKEEACSKQGDGFMSEVTVAEIVGKTGSGALYSNSVFIKRPVTNKVRAELFSMDLAFSNESTIYCDILPLIPEGSGNIPKCFYGGIDCIVLENLRAQGYKMADDKAQGLDLSHSQLVMKAIAKFHASTYALRILEAVKFCQLTSSLVDMYKVNTTVASLESSLLNGIYNLKQIDDKSLNSSLTKLEKLKGRMSFTLNEYRRSDLIVLGHGDLWFNNLMFLYHEGQVQDTKFIDLQAALPLSPAIDLWNFLYTCVSPDLLNICSDQLISTYCTTFRETLFKMNLAQNKIPDEEILRQEIYSRELYGFLAVVFYGPALYLDFSDESYNLDKQLSDPEFMKKFENNFCKDYADRLAALMKRCQVRNIL